MKKKFEYLIPSKNENGTFILKDSDTGLVRTDIYVRDIMCQHCIDNNQCIQYDIEAGRSMRKEMEMFHDMKPKVEESGGGGPAETTNTATETGEDGGATTGLETLTTGGGLDDDENDDDEEENEAEGGRQSAGDGNLDAAGNLD